MSKPDFIGVGTERAGTSWLFSMIAHHPESWVPPLKELHFLDTIDPDVPSHNPRYRWHLTSRIKQKATPFMNISHRPEFLKNTAFEYLLWDACYFSGSMNFEWYQRLFAERFVKGRIAGEYTPAYCNISEALIKKMLELNPYMKFLLVFRHPCQQIRSSLIQHFVMIENRPFASVGEDEMMEWLCAPFAQKKSNIGDVFEKWSRCLPQDQLFIGLYEEIKQAPEELIKRVYRFLGLNESFMPDRKFYANKINNLTKPDYIIPQIVLDYIDEHWGREAEHIQKNMPQLAQYWSNL
ncbi:MAG TPA: sulfotransferase [Alphaproteobacteria bacterium]|nr:sulfotransferase [Alphaproteobacteria bacterium]USO06566.1 MAG: sulfotransferase [Rhodospirillales bacterium]HOO81186.1 sulfotransferase [Alphaproteobacteria bacterium]